MPEWFYDAFSYFVMAYSAFILGSYVFFAILSFLEHKKHYTYHDDDYTIEELKKSPYYPSWHLPTMRKRPLSPMCSRS